MATCHCAKEWQLELAPVLKTVKLTLALCRRLCDSWLTPWDRLCNRLEALIVDAYMFHCLSVKNRCFILLLALVKAYAKALQIVFW